MSLTIRTGTCSLTGRRDSNEDAVAVHEFPELTVWLVADGMGGPDVGTVASRLGVAVTARELDKPARDAVGATDIPAAIRHAFHRADQAVQELILAAGRRASSTLVLALRLMGEDRLFIAQLGDSRAYHVRGCDILQLTDDHDIRTALIRNGTITAEQASRSRIRNVLWKFLGAAEVGDNSPDLTTLPIQDGDWVLLSTDGLHGLVTSEQMRDTIRVAGTAQRVADALCRRALEQGGRDNTSCIVLEVHA